VSNEERGEREDAVSLFSLKSRCDKERLGFATNASIKK